MCDDTIYCYSFFGYREKCRVKPRNRSGRDTKRFSFVWSIGIYNIVWTVYIAWDSVVYRMRKEKTLDVEGTTFVALPQRPRRRNQSQQSRKLVSTAFAPSISTHLFLFVCFFQLFRLSHSNIYSQQQKHSFAFYSTFSTNYRPWRHVPSARLRSNHDYCYC